MLLRTCINGFRIVFFFCRIDEDCYDDGFHLSPLAIYSWLTRVMYNRRSKFDPLWNTVVVGGFEKGQPYVIFNCDIRIHTAVINIYSLL